MKPHRYKTDRLKVDLQIVNALNDLRCVTGNREAEIQIQYIFKESGAIVTSFCAWKKW